MSNDTPPPPRLYTVDGETFYASRAELNRALSGRTPKLKAGKPSPGGAGGAGGRRRRRKGAARRRRQQQQQQQQQQQRRLRSSPGGGSSSAAALPAAAAAAAAAVSSSSASASASSFPGRGISSSSSSSPSLPALPASPERRPSPDRRAVPIVVDPSFSHRKDLGGSFGPLFFGEDDARQRAEDAYAAAEAAVEPLQDLFAKTASLGPRAAAHQAAAAAAAAAGGGSPPVATERRFTTDQQHFFPTMGALRAWHREIEKGLLPELDEDAEKAQRRAQRARDRQRSAMPTWWTGMPLNEKQYCEQFSLPTTPATTVVTLSSDEEEEAPFPDPEDVQRRLEEEETWKCGTCGKQNVWPEPKCVICARARTTLQVSAAREKIVALFIKERDAALAREARAAQVRNLENVARRTGGKVPPSMLPGYVEPESPAEARARLAREAEERERAAQLAKLLPTPRVEHSPRGDTPVMPDVALSPCKEWSLWTSDEMRSANLRLARMIQSWGSDFNQLQRVSMCNCRLDQHDATTLAHALRLPSTKITHLDLSYNHLTGKPTGSGGAFYDHSGFDRLCNAILWSKTLVSLNLAGNALLSCGARALAFPLARDAPLLELDVSDTNIALGLGMDADDRQFEDDGGLAEFAHALVRNTRLRHLRMFGIVMGHKASAMMAAAVCERATLDSFCDIPIANVLLHNHVRKLRLSGVMPATRHTGNALMDGAFTFISPLQRAIEATEVAEAKARRKKELKLVGGPYNNPVTLREKLKEEFGDEDAALPPRLLGLHCATVAVYLLRGLFERWDDCYLPKSMLRSLSFGNMMALEEETLVDLAHCLAVNRRLTALDIGGGGARTCKGVAAICDALQKNNSLISLRLSGHADMVASTGYRAIPFVKPFCDLLAYNSARSCRADIVEPVVLRSLCLSENGITPVACAALSEALADDRVLTNLDLSGNPIGLGKRGLATSVLGSLLGGRRAKPSRDTTAAAGGAPAGSSGAGSNRGLIYLTLSNCR